MRQQCAPAGSSSSHRTLRSTALIIIAKIIQVEPMPKPLRVTHVRGGKIQKASGSEISEKSRAKSTEGEGSIRYLEDSVRAC